MRIDYLIYFLNVAQTKSINISARQLYISQQSLSRAIKTLEHEIGAPLLERHYFGVELTKVGEIVAEHAGRIVKEHYSMQKALLPYLEPMSDGCTGDLHVGINYHIINELLYTIVYSFTRPNPNVKLQIRDGSVEEMTRSVLDGTLDLALYGDWAATGIQNICTRNTDRNLQTENTQESSDSAEASASPLTCEILYEAEILVCVSRKSPLASRRILSPEELLKEPLIQYTDQSITRSFFDGYGDPYILLETSSTDLFRQMIQTGSGYCLTNRLDWEEDYSFQEKNHLAVIPVRHPHAAVSYRVLYRKDRQDSPAVAAFLKIVKKRFQLLGSHHELRGEALK